MSGSFQTPVTIKQAVDNIRDNKYVLPAIQRTFVWKTYQIEMLFDSIMRGYPINSFMFWKISDREIKSSYKFYEAIREFRQYYNENNQSVNTNGDSDFYAVIDGFRANRGGTPLSFSGLLMSIASANWKKIDARQEFERLISEVRGIGRADFRAFIENRRENMKKRLREITASS